jgi:hypothetical protein
MATGPKSREGDSVVLVLLDRLECLTRSLTRSHMSELQLLHCSFCGQTFRSTRTEDCPLCRRSGGVRAAETARRMTDDNSKPDRFIWIWIMFCLFVSGYLAWSNLHRIWDLVLPVACCIPLGFFLVFVFPGPRRRWSRENLAYGLLWGLLISGVVVTILDIRRFVK